MAYTTINKHTDYFNTKLYTGNGSARSISSVGFQPDLVWVKKRSNADNGVFHDVLRGATKYIVTDNNQAEATFSNGLTSFDSDGYSLGVSNFMNQNTHTFASWNWKAGTTGSGTTSGSGTGKAYSYSVNTTSGFSIVKYVGNGTAGHTIPHHLGATADFVIVKALGNTESWQVISKAMDADKFIQLDSNNAQMSQGSYNMFNSTRPSSTVVTLGNQNHTNQNGTDYIMYAFSEKVGYSKTHGWTSNNNTDGVFLYTGFAPSFFLFKAVNDNRGWNVVDNKRPGYNVITKVLNPNDSAAESTITNGIVDFVSNGIKFRTDGSDFAGTSTFMGIAFGQSLVGSNNVPCTAR